MEAQPRILVVEDDFACQQVAVGMLGRLGFAVDVAASGAAAVAAARRYAYSLIFVECHLDGGDGFWAAREIRTCGESAAAPIIALTISDDSQMCLAAGMDAYLRKPVRLAEIERVVEEWLG